MMINGIYFTVILTLDRGVMQNFGLCKLDDL